MLQFAKFLAIAPDLHAHFASLVTHRTANILRCLDFLHKNIHEVCTRSLPPQALTTCMRSQNKPWSKLELLCSMFSFEHYDANQVVVKRGEGVSETNKFYVIAVGSVEVCPCLFRSATQWVHC